MTARREVLRLGLGAVALAGAPRRARAGALPAIRVDQLGYRPGDRKLALVAASPSAFAVREATGGWVVLEGAGLAVGARDRGADERVAVLDLSALTAPGQYVVTAPGAVPSPPFRIAEDVYADPLRTVLASFGFQRCGAAVGGGLPWSHAPCHLDDAAPWGGGARRDATGGWHDAGDYGKYVPPAALTLWHLAALQEPPRRASPALLAEMRWELDWLVRMQRDDGAVHHKVGPARWTADRPPDRDPERRYLFGVSSAATAGFTAVAAQAARLFEAADPAYARRLLERAEAGWRWLLRQPGNVPPGGFENPPGVDGSGAYGDRDDGDERFWAAVELWRATGDARYRPAVLAALARGGAFEAPASWENVRPVAALSLLASGSPLGGEARARLAAELLAWASGLGGLVGGGGYRVALRPDEYYWGSNGLALERAVALLAAHRETGRGEFRDWALDQLHYVLGRNALGKSFVTGLGADPPRRPYHQPSLTNPRGVVVPGLVVGGPNAASARLKGAPPARAYRDDDRLYEVNEPSIYWTAALAHVLAALQPDSAGARS